MNLFKVDRKVWAWALYDFGNSAFATTVLSVVFNVYFAQRVVPPEGVLLFGTRVAGPALWGGLASLSMLVVFLVSPVLGAAADEGGRCKRFLLAFWLLGCLGSAGLFFVRPGDVGLGAVFFLVGNVGFSGGNAFYNAFLPGLAEPARMGFVSGLGWAVGYLGGGLCLALNLAMIKAPAFFGLGTADFLPVRACFLTVGLWWFLFGLPLFFWVPERRASGPDGEPATFGQSLVRGLSRLAGTFRQMRRYGNLLKFLAAYLLYNDGIETVILMASLVGAGLLGMGQDELILCFLMIQGVALAGSLVFGRLSDRIGHRATVFVTLGVYVGAVFWGWRMDSPREFWILGAVVGIVLGGSQSASRSLMGLLTPPEKSAEFFAFYGLAGKLTAAFGPLVFGVASQVWGLRNGILSLLGFFLAGGAVLAFVREGGAAPTGGSRR